MRTNRTFSRETTSRRSYLKSLGAGAGVAVGLAGCLGAGGGGAGGVDTVEYGVINPLAGPYAGLGENQRRGHKLGVKHVSESDEWDFTIEAVYEDSQSQTAVARRKAQKLVEQDGVSFMGGCVSSAASLALNSFAADNEIVFNPGGGAIQITGSGCSEWAFRAETHSGQIAKAFGPWIPKNLGTKGWIHYADYAYGQDIDASFTEEMKAADASVDIVGRTTSQLGAQNFSSFISEIKDSEAEFVLLGLAGGDLITFVKQAVNAGLKDQVDIASPTMCMQVIRGALGADAVDTYGGVRYYPTIDTPNNQTFLESYRAEYDADPDSFARAGYDSIVMTAQGIKEAGSDDPATVRETLAGVDGPSVYGPTAFRECDHQAPNPVWVGQNVAADGGAKVELLEKKTGEEATPACSEVTCEL